MRPLPVPVSHLPYTFFLVLSNLCLSLPRELPLRRRSRLYRTTASAVPINQLESLAHNCAELKDVTDQLLKFNAVIKAKFERLAGKVGVNLHVFEHGGYSRRCCL